MGDPEAEYVAGEKVCIVKEGKLFGKFGTITRVRPTHLHVVMDGTTHDEIMEYIEVVRAVKDAAAVEVHNREMERLIKEPRIEAVGFAAGDINKDIMGESPAKSLLRAAREVKALSALMGHDMVNHPPHYNQGEVECIDAIKSAVTGLQGFEAHCIGTAIKYLWRWKHKGGVEDLKKATWYISRLIPQDNDENSEGN